MQNTGNKTKTIQGEYMEKLDPSCIVGRNVNDAAAMENSLEIPQKIKHRTITPSSNFTLGSMPRKWTLNKCSCTSVHNSIIHKSPKVGKTKTAINKWINKRWYVYTMEIIQPSKGTKFSNTLQQSTCYNYNIYNQLQQNE